MRDQQFVSLFCKLHCLLLMFSCSVMSSSLWPHGLQDARLPCPSLFPRVCTDSCSLGWWCHPTISSFITLFSSCPQSFPESGSFPMSCLFALDGWRIGASASLSVLPMNFQGWFPLGPRQHQIVCDRHFCPSRAHRTWWSQRTPIWYLSL